jgi:hypothetical protein
VSRARGGDRGRILAILKCLYGPSGDAFTDPVVSCANELAVALAAARSVWVAFPLLAARAWPKAASGCWLDDGRADLAVLLAPHRARCAVRER